MASVDLLNDGIIQQVIQWVENGQSYEVVSGHLNLLLRVDAETQGFSALDVEIIYKKAVEDRINELSKAQSDNRTRLAELRAIDARFKTIYSFALSEFTMLTDPAQANYNPAQGAGYLRIALQANMSNADMLNKAGLLPSRNDEIQINSIQSLGKEELHSLELDTDMSQKQIRRALDLVGKLKADGMDHVIQALASHENDEITPDLIRSLIRAHEDKKESDSEVIDF